VSGCQVNGIKVEKNGEQKLYNGDQIKFGNCKISIADLGTFRPHLVSLSG